MSRNQHASELIAAVLAVHEVTQVFPRPSIHGELFNALKKSANPPENIDIVDTPSGLEVNVRIAVALGRPVPQTAREVADALALSGEKVHRISVQVARIT